MRFTPFPYQFDAMKFALSRPGAGLLLSVGLGKTAIMLGVTKILHETGQVKRTLLVAPLRALYQVWPVERDKWDDYRGIRLNNLRDNGADDAAHIEMVNPENLLAVLSRFPRRWDHLIIDESSMFKNSQTQRFRAIRAVLRQFKFRHLLTGSPAPNGLMDIWAQAFILDNGSALGEYITHFRNRYCMKDGFGTFAKWQIIPGYEEKIYDALRPIMFRVSTADSGLKLPRLLHNRLTVELPDDARQTYKEMETQFLTIVENETIISPNAAAAGMRCRQIANGRLYSNGQGKPRKVATLHTAKLEALSGLIEEQAGAPLLVFYEFKHDAEAIQAVYKNIPDLTEMTNEKQIMATVGAWNRGEIPVMIGHPTSIGKALNLQGSCSAVCFYGITWNLDSYEQGIGRVQRQGNDAETVVVHHIVANDTLDDVVLNSLRGKAKTQNDLNAALSQKRSHI